MLRSLYSLDLEIQQLKQKIYEGDGAQKGNHGILDERLSHSTSPTSPTKPQPPLVDDRQVTCIPEMECKQQLQKRNILKDHSARVGFDLNTVIVLKDWSGNKIYVLYSTVNNQQPHLSRLCSLFQSTGLGNCRLKGI